MALKDLQIRALRPADKIYQCPDDRGLYLEVHPNGSKLWRYKYRFLGKQKRLALGRYPEIGLGEARQRRDEAKRTLTAGTDPLAARKHEKLVAVFNASNRFSDIAKEYIEKMVRDGRASTTTEKASWLLKQLEPISTCAISDIKAIDVLAALKRIEARGKYETARRCRSFASRVFRYAVATGRGDGDPTTALRGALVAPKVKHHAAILDPGLGFEPKKLGTMPRLKRRARSPSRNRCGGRIRTCQIGILARLIAEACVVAARLSIAPRWHSRIEFLLFQAHSVGCQQRTG